MQLLQFFTLQPPNTGFPPGPPLGGMGGRTLNGNVVIQASGINGIIIIKKDEERMFRPLDEFASDLSKRVSG